MILRRFKRSFLTKRFSSTFDSTQVTTLDNGIRVATVGGQGHFVSVGVYVNTGSRYEDAFHSGASHMMDRMAFKSTKLFNADEIVRQLEAVGGNIQSHSSRETIMYQASVFPSDVAKILNVFGQIVQYPSFTEAELQESKESTAWELQQIGTKPDMILPEYLHQVAYKKRDLNGQLAPANLGNPLLIPLDRLESMSSTTLRSFHDIWYTPNNIVIAGVGVDHTQFVELANREFGAMPKVSSSKLSQQQYLITPPTYSGGISVVDTMGKRMSPNPDDLDLTHVQIGFETCSAFDPDIYAVSTLNSLMGGGGSFSAGGPGKGMYSRLYTQVLNQRGWIESCNMNNHSYNDTGLMVISAAVPPQYETHKYVLDVLCEQLVLTTHAITDEELDRAKNRLKSNLLMSLESKMSEAEDIGRQVLIHGKRIPASTMCERIDLVTKDDIHRVARNLIFGEKTPNPHSFNDGVTKSTSKTGDGRPSIYVQGPLVKNDPLYDAEAIISRWGIGKQIKKRSWFQSIKG